MPFPPERPTATFPYQVEARIGEGAMGVVYRAVEPVLERRVAIKSLRLQLLAGEAPEVLREYRLRFLQEARAVAALSHPGATTLFRIGEEEGTPYIAMEWLDGRTLEAVLQEEGKLAPERAAGLLLDLLGTLDAAHRAGIVHRDVKPANVLLTADGSALLTDFGLAKGSAYTVLTRRGQVLGTVDYLAPEIIRGEPATPASDLYGLGCVVYDCLAGKPPFAGKGLLELGLAQLEEEPQPPCEGSLGWAVLQALEKDPARRPPTAVAYASMLRVALREQT